MIRLDENNSIKIKAENNKVKLILYLKKDYNKNIQIEISLNDESLESIIADLICAKAKIGVSND